MKRLIDFMTERAMPRINVITANPWVKALQNAMIIVVPMILASSVITILSLLREIDWVASWLPDLSMIQSVSFGLLGLFVSFCIPYNVMDLTGHGNRKVLTGLLGIGTYLLAIDPLRDADGISWMGGRMDSSGMLFAIVTGLFVAAVMNFFIRFSFFKNATGIPDFVTNWFDSLLPILTSLTTAWFVVDILDFDAFGTVARIFEPLATISDSLPGFVLLSFITVFLYSFGISPWLLQGVLYPIMLSNINENFQAVQAGLEATHVYTYEAIYCGWVTIGGIGTTLPLVVMMVVAARSKRNRAVGRAVLVPSVLNINEPVVFGAPIVFNPILMIPFWLNGIVVSAVVWIGLKSGLAPTPSKVMNIWYAPFPITTWLTSPAVGSLILFAIVVAVASLIWFPFFTVYDRQLVRQEAEEIAAAGRSDDAPGSGATATDHRVTASDAVDATS